jgi:hypothetical protein
MQSRILIRLIVFSKIQTLQPVSGSTLSLLGCHFESFNEMNADALVAMRARLPPIFQRANNRQERVVVKISQSRQTPLDAPHSA